MADLLLDPPQNDFLAEAMGTPLTGLAVPKGVCTVLRLLHPNAPKRRQPETHHLRKRRPSMAYLRIGLPHSEHQVNSAMKLAAASTIRSRVRCTGCRLYRQIDWTISNKSRQSLALGERPRV
jgi:hypothetical protein